MDIGDVVYLRSNPNTLMTIEDCTIWKDELVLFKCIWMNSNNELQTNLFNKKTLVLKDDE